ncbi:NAD(P)-dependent alcohol dehydrogenase [Umezawaea sp. NPDC059074]|uniref:zinc-dependent alcohol dehydrogenase family protein n=1 Tax=Umezawaea sp. NPDC059074 TaxID=3346716 RepID=UPI0036C1D613
MRKWVLEPGITGLDALVLKESPVPEPGPGQVRVAVKAASLNYRDQILLHGRWGITIEEEVVPLGDASGVIDAVGPGVEEWRVGDRVLGIYHGGWIDGPPPAEVGFGLGSPGQDGVLAEYIVLNADRVTRMPSTLDFVEASTLPCAALTAWSALTGDKPVRAGQRVLTLGTGGVSLFALQLALAMGAEVTALTGQDVKASRLLDLGATDVINYRTTPNWGEVVHSATGGMDKVVNTDGGNALTQSLAAVSAGGEIAFVGLFSEGDAPPPLLVLMTKAASIRGVAVGSATAFTQLIDFVDQHGIKPVVRSTFAFEDAKAAYTAQAGADVFGKIVVEVAPQS